MFGAAGKGLIAGALLAGWAGGAMALDVADFRRKIDDFDPLGKAITQPLQRSVPGLEMKANLQNLTSLSIHKDMNQNRNLPSTSSNFQGIHWLMDLQTAYRVSSDLKFTVRNMFLYNSAYDWNDGFRNSFYDSMDTLHYYNSMDQIFREWYADYQVGGFQLRVGKQQVSWGRVDGRQILDMVHGFDYTWYPFPTINPFIPVEYQRIPEFMVNADYFFKGYEFQFLWIPNFESSFGPTVSGSPWEFNPRASSAMDRFSRVSFAKADKPARSFEDSQIGAKLGAMKYGWDVSLHYLWSWYDMPTMFQNVLLFDRFNLPPMPKSSLAASSSLNTGFIRDLWPPVHVHLNPKYTRVHKFGLGADRSFDWLGRQWAFKFEGRYLKDRYYQVRNYTPENHGWDKADSLLAGIQLETYFYKDWTNILRWDHEHIFGYDGDMLDLPVGSPLNRNQEGIYWTVLKPFGFTNDRLTMRSLWIWLSGDGGFRYEPNMTYELSEKLTVLLGGHLYWGKPGGVFGQFARHDGVDLGVQYVF